MFLPGSFQQVCVADERISSTKILRETLDYTRSSPCVSPTPPKFVHLPSSHSLPAPDPTVYPISPRNPCREPWRQNLKLSRGPCTDSLSGSRTSGSYTPHDSLDSRSSRSTIGYTTPRWKGWRIRIGSCVRRSRSRAIGMRLLRLCLGARDRLGRSGFCGRFSGCRIKRAHELRPF